MPADAADTDVLLGRVAHGDSRAVGELMDRHRPRLRRMVALRLDPRVLRRIDPSDVVQEALTEASRKLPAYVETRPIPFYPWLRQIAWERLVHLHGKHVRTAKRSVAREQALQLGLTDASVADLANRLVGRGSSPSHALVQAEQRERLRAALDGMQPSDREVLVMWYLEDLSVDDIAAVLDLTPAGVKSRHRRALLRLTAILSPGAEEA